MVRGGVQTSRRALRVFRSSFIALPTPKSTRKRLSVEDKRGADLVSARASDRVRKALGVEGKTEARLDTSPKSLRVTQDEKSGVVDLGLDEGGRVEVGLGSDLEVHASDGRLGVVDGLGTGLDLRGDAVVVRRREDGEVAEGVDGGSVLRSGVANGTSVAGDGTSLDVVGRLSSNEEAVTGGNSVSSERGSLEEVDGGASVDSGGLRESTSDRSARSASGWYQSPWPVRGPTL